MPGNSFGRRNLASMILSLLVLRIRVCIDPHHFARSGPHLKLKVSDLQNSHKCNCRVRIRMKMDADPQYYRYCPRDVNWRNGGIGRSPVRKTIRSVLIIFNQTAALFMTNNVWDTSQLNIDILMSGSHSDFDVWVVSSCQQSTPGLNL